MCPARNETKNSAPSKPRADSRLVQITLGYTRGESVQGLYVLAGVSYSNIFQIDESISVR